ncbi:MAG: MBL fold metallo-hydrolase [Peptostreptococcales bacterium]|jgi:L-ascorbate metabolism protein UlaG (beta-lactamase superfamily)
MEVFQFKPLDVNIKYIFHSGFSVEIGSRLFVFDYFRGNLDLPSDKDIVVFSSHNHPDHFTPQIFNWGKSQSNIRYILSSDIEMDLPPSISQDQVSFMSPYEDFQIDDIHIQTFGSTDAGVSFLITYKGITIFHAGDLNWWYWWGETAEEIKLAEELFKAEIDKIRGRQIDIAFFPVDPRLEHNYHLGGQYFIQEIGPKIFIPMHFGHDLTGLHHFAEDMRNEGTQIILLTEPGQSTLL